MGITDTARNAACTVGNFLFDPKEDIDVKKDILGTKGVEMEKKLRAMYKDAEKPHIYYKRMIALYTGKAKRVVEGIKLYEAELKKVKARGKELMARLAYLNKNKGSHHPRTYKGKRMRDEIAELGGSGGKIESAIFGGKKENYSPARLVKLIEGAIEKQEKRLSSLNENLCRAEGWYDHYVENKEEEEEDDE